MTPETRSAMARGRFEIDPVGPYSLASSVRFLEGFAPASYEAGGADHLRLAFVADGFAERGETAAGAYVYSEGDRVVGGGQFLFYSPYEAAAWALISHRIRIVPATTLHLVDRRIRSTRRAGDALRWLQHETDRRPNNDQTTDQPALIEALHDQIAYLRDQLTQERAANRENRRIIAAYQGRIPELGAPSEPREDLETTTEDDGRGEGRGGIGGPPRRP